jgi:DNA modification methylase
MAKTQLSIKWPSPEGAEDFKPVLYLTPNPHLGDFCDPSTSAKEVEEPYLESISAGKNTYVYDAHTYHTKVPPQGIRLLIDYYTRPSDVVLDPFCGSGMTGVAAAERGRKVILSDLSPAAAFIAYNLNTPIDPGEYLEAVYRLLEEAEGLEHFLYDTHCRACEKIAPMLYTVWSYGFVCDHCDKEFVLWDVARDERPSVKESKIKSEFDCPHCQVGLKKRALRRTRRYPVLVGYRCCERSLKEATSPPDEYDLATLEKIEASGVPPSLWYPTAPFPDGVNTRQPIAAGITTVDQAYTVRALWAMAYLWDRAQKWPEPEVKDKLLFTLTSLYQRVTVFSEFRFWGGSGNTANFNVPAIMNEQNVFRAFEWKANTISWYFKHAAPVARKLQVSAQSASRLTQLPDKSVDYVFTDPPFGGNINYSEMNFLWESWLRVYTDNKEEAIVNKVQKKGFDEYRELLTAAFSEIRRVLKDNGWLTVVFHNSSEKVWMALQKAVSEAGFKIRGTQTFDKEHGTFKQFVSDNAVGYDLVIHCRKSEEPRPPSLKEKSDVIEQARVFVQQAVRGELQNYIVRYLHVRRGDEFDYRKLYANWLADALPKSLVSLSFEEFRGLVDEVLRQETQRGSVLPPR